MSGGFFNYVDSTLKNEIFGYGERFKNVFEDMEISHIIYDIFNVIHAYDWYVSGDTSEEDYLEVKRRFKAKYLKNNKELTKEMIDLAIANAKKELYQTYGILEEVANNDAEQ